MTTFARDLLIVYFTLGTCMSLKTKRIVFQSYSVGPADTVRCYGRCKLQGSPQKLKSDGNSLLCEGRQIRLKCDSSKVIQITKSIKGKLSPDFDLCNFGTDCTDEITKKVQNKCGGRNECKLDATNETTTKQCGYVNHLAIDIKYQCIWPVIIPKTNPVTKLTTMIPTTLRKITTIRKSTKSIQDKATSPVIATISKTSTTTNRPILPIIYLPTSTRDADVAVIYETEQADTNGMFWAMTAYTTLSNSEFIKNNKTHLALALLLSMFAGMVLCLCFFLDYCRRAKKRKSKQILENNKMGLVQDIHPLVECGDNFELMRPKIVEVLSMNGSLPRHKVLSCGDDGCLNNNHQLDRGCDIYADSAPFFKRSLEHKSLIHHNHIHQMQDRPFSPNNLPAPPNHFLIDTSSSSSNELVPPPDEYISDEDDLNDMTCTSIRASTPSGSINKTLSSPQKLLAYDQLDEDDEESELVAIEEVYLAEQELADHMEGEAYEYVEVAPYHHGSDEYSSSPFVPRNLMYHRTDNYVVGPKAKYASMTSRRTTSNDETSQEESLIRQVDPKQQRHRKNNSKEKPSLQKSKSLDEPKRKYFTLNSHHLVRNPKNKGRIHVMQRCTDSLPRRGYNQKAIYSDNEASRRRRRYDTPEAHGCCHDNQEPHMKCCSSLTSNGHSSQDGDNHGPLLSISNELIKNKQCCVEESGYQSHDTGTDSLCSSSFSTDQEDSRMFLPSSNARTCDCRSKSCRTRGHSAASKRDPRFIIVRDNNNKCRRIRHDDYVDMKGHHVHVNNHTKLDTQRIPYDSSMDDTSSRDSVKLFRKIRKNMTDCNNGDGMNCNCLHELKSPDTRVRMDGTETS